MEIPVRALALLGVVQLAALAPVAWALGRRLPASRLVRVATVVGTVALVALAVLGALLVAGVLTSATQILTVVVVTVVAVYGWLLAVNLVGHRTHALPRLVTRVGMLLGAGLLVGMVLVAAGLLLPGVAGRLASWVGYGLGGAAWLALPAYVLLLAVRVYSPSPPFAAPADSDLNQGALRP